MEELKTTLKEYGLTEKEASLYLAGVSLGESTMSRLAKEAGLKRSTAYLTFEGLEQRGLMGSFEVRSGLRFVATSPSLLMKTIEQKTEIIRTAIPRLEAIAQKSIVKPHIRYYEGEEGYRIASEESLEKQNSTVLHIGSLANLYTIVSPTYDNKHYIPERIKKHIGFKALYFASETPDSMLERDHIKELREIRYLPESHKHTASKLIYGNKVAIFSAREELVTVIIESETIAQAERETFDLIWDLVGPSKK